MARTKNSTSKTSTGKKPGSKSAGKPAAAAKKAPAKKAPAKKAPGTRKRKPSVKAKALANKTAKNNKNLDELDSEDESSGSEEDELEDGDANLGTLSVDWSDPALSEALVSRIMESAEIKRALYPPPGPNASTAKGGGKTKVGSQWQLCLNLLGEDPKYKEALAAVTTPKERTAYANKIKNRLRAMAKITREYMDEMGQTGAGIRSADEIDTSLNNTFTTKWDEISKACPWFFDMRDLIAQHPNLVPTGLGHSDTGFDLDVLGGAPVPSDPASDAEDEPTLSIDEYMGSDEDVGSRSVSQINDIPAQSDNEFPAPHQLNALVGSDADYQPSEGAAHDMDGDELDNADEEERKKKAKKLAAQARKTAAKAGTSKPAPLPTPNPTTSSSKKTKMAEFADIAKSEEVTRQKELDLANLRARQSLKVLDVKSRLEMQREERRREDKQACREERREKLKIKQMKLQHAHELRMARFTAGGASMASHAARFPDPRDAGGGSAAYSSSEPDYSGFGSSVGSSRNSDMFSQAGSSYSFPSYDE